jgi:hypothetical protein
MKKIFRGAILPAFVVAMLQFFFELVFPIAAFGQAFERQLRMAFVMIAASQTTLLIGAGIYALILRRRTAASVPVCVVGGAMVGLLANLASQFVKSVILCLMLALVLSRIPEAGAAVWTVILAVMSLWCLATGIGGLVLGEIGGGLVGLLAMWRRERTNLP